MIELIQIPWSPFCIVQRRILEFARASFATVDVPTSDRSLVWRLTRQRYYAVPVLRDGRKVLFEVAEDSQVIAKYLDSKWDLGLFPAGLEGVQSLIWRDIEGNLEGLGFKLNDSYWREFVPARERLPFLRHKERKFGRGCLDHWQEARGVMLAELEQRLLPYDQMLIDHEYLLDDRPRFVDFDLFGILGNFLFTGHHSLPPVHRRLLAWHDRMSRIQIPPNPREEELRPRHQRTTP